MVMTVIMVMVVDKISNKKVNQIVTELLIGGRKLNTSTVLIKQSYIIIPKYVQINCIHFNYENSKQIIGSTTN